MSNPARLILVVGATGELGSRVAQLLLQRGAAVRCLVRPATDATGLHAAGAEIVRADLTDPDSLPCACAGVAVVVATATAIARQLTGARHPSMREVDEHGMAALVDAAERAGVERFVYLSYAGVEAGLRTPLERAKLATEQRLRSATMRPVILRPDAFQDLALAPPGRFDIAHGKVAVFGRGDTKRRPVSTSDVAALVAALTIEPDPPAIIEVGGPEAISRNEAIALAERLTGRRMKRQRLPRPLTRLGMRLLARTNPALASVFGIGLLQDLQQATWDDSPLRQRGIEPLPASDYIRKTASTA